MDVERCVAQRLREITGFDVYIEEPDPRPESFVTVELTGSPSKRFLKEPTLAVQSWAKTRRQAADMASDVELACWRLAAYDEFVRVGSTSTYRWPDPESRHQRYQTVVNLTVHT